MNQKPLSPRQRQVAALLAQGKRNAEIAVELNISPGTVDAHTAALYGKTGFRNRTELAAWWLTQPDEPEPEEVTA